MNADPQDPTARRRPYWLIPVALGLLALPAGTASLVLAGALLGSAALSLARGAIARRARRTAAVAGPHGVTLGVDRRGPPVRLSDEQLGAHGLIVGASGAGKSTTMLQILTEQIRRGQPVVAIDMKGSPGFAAQLEAAATAAGRPFRIWTPDGAEHWNPLQHGNATALKDKLISSERFTEPHYQRAAERYVQTVMQVLLEAHPGCAPTLTDVVRLMEPKRLSAALRGLPSARAGDVQDYLASMTPDQLSAVRGFGTRLAILSESHTGPYLVPGAQGTIDLRSALAGDEVVLLSVNSSVYGRLSAQLGALAIQDLVAATGTRLTEVERGGIKPPLAFVAIDEFSALGADNVLALIARGRASGVSVLLATQEVADLDRAGHGFRDQVLGLTAVKLIHRQDVPASAQLVAEMAGTVKEWEHTYHLGRGPLGNYSTSRGTRRQVERFVIHPNVVKGLRTGEAILLTKNPAAEVRLVTVSPPRDAPAAMARASAAPQPREDIWPHGRSAAYAGRTVGSADHAPRAGPRHAGSPPSRGDAGVER